MTERTAASLQLLKVDARDNVATALQDLPVGAANYSADGSVLLTEPVRRGHKVALAVIRAGTPVIKYGFTCARATMPIAIGQHVHTHNAATTLQPGASFAYQPEVDPRAAPAHPPQFMGYRRAGRTRGYTQRDLDHSHGGLRGAHRRTHRPHGQRKACRCG